MHEARITSFIHEYGTHAKKWPLLCHAGSSITFLQPEHRIQNPFYTLSARMADLLLITAEWKRPCRDVVYSLRCLHYRINPLKYHKLHQGALLFWTSNRFKQVCVKIHISFSHSPKHHDPTQACSATNALHGPVLRICPRIPARRGWRLSTSERSILWTSIRRYATLLYEKVPVVFCGSWLYCR